MINKNSFRNLTYYVYMYAYQNFVFKSALCGPTIQEAKAMHKCDGTSGKIGLSVLLSSVA